MNIQNSEGSFLVKLRQILLLLIAIGSSLPRPSDASGIWTNVVQPSPAPVGLMLLLPNGTVMAQQAGTTATWYRLTPDIHGSYTNGAWATIAPMNYARQFYASVVLTNGNVFVAGGEYGTPGGNRAELYNPASNSWTEVPVPAGLVCTTCSSPGISDAGAILLADGTVMIAPVRPTISNGTLIYNPALNTITAGPPTLEFQNEASWVKLPDDSILTIDPRYPNPSQSGFDSERFIPALNKWIPDRPLTVQLWNSVSEIGPGILLPNKKVIFFGSTGTNVVYTPSGTTNFGTWSVVKNTPVPYCGWDNPASMTVDGKVLCLFGCGALPDGIYEYDPGADTFTPAGSWDNSGNPHSMLALPDGNILMSDGISSFVHMYVPGGPPLPSGKPTISSITPNPDGSYHLTGTGLNGISQGAAFGDDAQMDSNFPLVRLTSGTYVYYATTFNWSSTGVATGNKSVSTEFSLPVSVSPGAYSLAVVANGIGSDPVQFYAPGWVDFNYAGLLQFGTYDFPFTTLADGILSAPAGGTINIKTAGHSAESITITNAITIIAVGGPATIGQ